LPKSEGRKLLSRELPRCPPRNSKKEEENGRGDQMSDWRRKSTKGVGGTTFRNSKKLGGGEARGLDGNMNFRKELAHASEEEMGRTHRTFPIEYLGGSISARKNSASSSNTETRGSK